MKTKEKIIQSALRLYNKKGLYNVSSRDICRDLDISPGNFSYHYPSIQRLCTDLFSRLIQALESSNQVNDDWNLQHYLDRRLAVMKIQYQYRFFYLNLHDIIQKFDGIKDFYILHHQEECSRIIADYRLLETKGYIQKALSDTQRSSIQKSTQILQNSWLIDASLHQAQQIGSLIPSYLYHQIESLLLPYLRQENWQIITDYFRQINN
jgi:AcrR family transcriptional regulator